MPYYIVAWLLRIPSSIPWERIRPVLNMFHKWYVFADQTIPYPSPCPAFALALPLLCPAHALLISCIINSVRLQYLIRTKKLCMKPWLSLALTTACPPPRDRAPRPSPAPSLSFLSYKPLTPISSTLPLFARHRT